MHATLRPATAADVPGIVALKQSLARERTGRSDPGGPGRGGFLLGSSAETYAAQADDPAIEVWVVERPADPDTGPAEILGFAVCLGDAAFRRSEVWAKQDLLDTAATGPTAPDLAAIAGRKLGYFDQLAVAEGTAARRWAAPLAARALTSLYEREGTEVVLATTVAAPFRNTAAHGLLRRVGAVELGEVSEVYPQVGAIRSAVFMVDCAHAVGVIGRYRWAPRGSGDA